MTAIILYYLVDYIRSFRYVPPITIYILWTIVSYTYIPNPVYSSYAISCSMLFFISAWICITFMENEDMTQTQITIIHAKSITKITFCRILSVLFIPVVLSLFAIAYPIIIQAFNRSITVHDILIALVSHLLISLLSISITIHFCGITKGKTLTSWLLLTLTLLLSLIRGGIEDMFPSAISFLSKFLPPAFSILDLLGQEVIHLNIELLLAWGYVFSYSIMLCGIHFIRIRKGNYRG